MAAPIMRVNTVNPRGVIPGPMQTPTTNFFEQGRQNQQAQYDRERKQEREDFDFEQAKRSAEREPYDKMIENPAAAEMIAQQYGITLDDNMRELLKRPQQAKLYLDGMSVATNAKITNPQALMKFTSAWAASNGNPAEAFSAVQGMELGKPEKPSYAHIRNIGSSAVYNAQTGEFKKNPYAPESTPTKIHTTGMPPGYHYDSNQGKAVPIPGTDPSMYVNKNDPLRDLVNLLAAGGADMQPIPNTPSGAPATTSAPPLKAIDPEEQKLYDSYIE